jgi:hypothetical protein
MKRIALGVLFSTCLIAAPMTIYSSIGSDSFSAGASGFEDVGGAGVIAAWQFTLPGSVNYVLDDIQASVQALN